MWEETSSRIQPLSKKWFDKAWRRLDNLTKPRRSLGRLEEIAARVVAIRQEDRPSTEEKEVFVFVGDHGVVSEGVSAYPQEVTVQMVPGAGHAPWLDEPEAAAAAVRAHLAG